jgi:hypothetical protein
MLVLWVVFDGKNRINTKWIRQKQMEITLKYSRCSLCLDDSNLYSEDDHFLRRQCQRILSNHRQTELVLVVPQTEPYTETAHLICHYRIHSLRDRIFWIRHVMRLAISFNTVTSCVLDNGLRIPAETWILLFPINSKPASLVPIFYPKVIKHLEGTANHSNPPKTEILNWLFYTSSPLYVFMT